MPEAIIGLGTNMGDRRTNLTRAAEALSKLERTSVKKVSHVYETEPVGFEEQGKFLNCVAAIATCLEPTELLQNLLGIEKDMGRVRTVRWGPRVIDMDILLYEGVTIRTAELEIPHPRMWQRAFVLVPLKDVIAATCFTELSERIDAALAACGDRNGVRLYGDL